MGGAGRKHGKDQKRIKIVVVKSEGKRPFGIYGYILKK